MRSLQLHGIRALQRGNVRHASFVASAFRGRIDPEELFPFPTTTLQGDAREALGDQAAARGYFMPRNGSAVPAGPSQSEETENGWGLMVPEEFGGCGASHPGSFDAISNGSSASYAAVHSHGFRTAYLARSFASKSHKGRILLEMSDTKVGWAVHEFASPNDPCSGTTTAVQDATNPTLCINGTKVLEGAADGAPCKRAAMLVTIVRTEKSAPPPSLGWIMLDLSTKGVSLDGPSIVTLKDVVVPMDDVFVAAGDGYRSCMTVALTAQYAVAACSSALSHEVAPLLPPHAVASLLAEAYAINTVGSALAANVEKGVLDTFFESALLGWMVHRFLGRLQAAAPMASADIAAVQRLAAAIDPFPTIAASGGIEDFAEVFNATSTLDTMQARTARSLGFVDRLPEVPNFATEAQLVEAGVDLLGATTEKLAVRHGAALRTKQLALDRVGEATGLIYASAAVVSRAQRAVLAKVPTAEAEQSYARVFTNEATAKATQLLRLAGSQSETADDACPRLAGAYLGE